MKFLGLSLVLMLNSLNLIDAKFETAYVAMRDGIKLAVDYHSVNDTGKYPAILELTPYGRGPGGINFRDEGDYWYEHGFVILIADSRGTGDSQGDMEFFAREGDDGYDLIDWIGRQPWSSGAVAMHGSSYKGTNQWYVAAKSPPNLKCIAPSATLGRMYDHVPYHDGAFALFWALGWAGQTIRTPTYTENWITYSADSWLTHRPINTLDVFATGNKLPLYRTFLLHPPHDPYWKTLLLNGSDYFRIRIPSLSFTGWYDSTLYGTIMHYNNVQKYSHGDHYLIVGPYMHSNSKDGGLDSHGQPIKVVGDLHLADNAFLPGLEMHRQFYEWCLKNGTQPKWNSSRVYITGSNKWTENDRFGPRGDQLVETSFHLTKSGGLTKTKPDLEQSLSYVYDPSRPVRSDDLPKMDYPIDMGYYLNRTDFLVFTSERLEEPLTVIGDVNVDLVVSINTTDTDFVCFLMDVLEDGKSIRLGSLAATLVRTRYRNGYDTEEFVEPNKPFKITINMHQIGHTFLKGHQIRLAVTSSFYPWISANPNTGNPIDSDISQPLVSNQTLHLGKSLNGVMSRVRFETWPNFY